MEDYLPRRAELQFHGARGIFIQATVAFVSNIPLFLMLGLVSSIYEVTMERSPLLSDVSLSSPNTSFSLHFSFQLTPSEPFSSSSLIPSLCSSYFVDHVNLFLIVWLPLTISSIIYLSSTTSFFIWVNCFFLLE